MTFMSFFRVKPQNVLKIVILFILGAIWGTIDQGGFLGMGPLIVSGVLTIAGGVMIGSITHFVLKLVGINLYRKKEVNPQLIDHEQKELTEKEKEDQNDQIALNLGIAWIIFIIASYFF